MDLDVDPAAPPAATPAAAPPRPRWFGGLRRRRPRLLGGVAAGLADFWAVDPLLVRVALVAPFIAGLLALMALPWFDAYFSGLAVLGTQLLWLVAAATVTGYALAWVLIPREDRPSIAQKLHDLEGTFGALVKLVVAVVGLSLLGYAWLAFGLSLANLGLDPMALALGGFLVAVGLGLAALWTSRERDLRLMVGRLGTPGLGRFDAADDAGAAAPAQPADASAPLTPPQRDSGPTAPPPATTNRFPAPAPANHPPAPESTNHPPQTPVPFGTGVGPTVVDAPPPGSVDRARAAAEAAAQAEAAAAEAARRARAEERRARRAAARAERKQRNRWGWLVASVTLMAAGLLALTDRMGLTDLGLLGVGVISLALLTTGIVVGAFFGSARWLILPSLLLAGTLAAGTAVTGAIDRAAAATAHHLAPTSMPTGSAQQMHWELAAVTVDLTQTRNLAGHGLDLSVDRGSLTVIVPADQWTTVSSEVLLGTNHLAETPVRIGDVSIATSAYDEWGMPQGEVVDYSDLLSLHLRVGIGELTVIPQES